MFNVDNEFPKLPMDIKREEIKSIQYTIDTNLCSKHLISISELSKIKEED